ncbi:5-formyltetrahydrofolate cyclo-ligase [Rhodobacteraceae bacterium NNCM2]|nr:5-formyltetrahydrofolate cyclo-ligase [Coraliihabitans acroporae]
MDLSEEKAALRKRAFAARKVAHADRGDSPLAARDHFLAGRMHTGAAVISAYCPIRTEIDPTPLMEALHAAGHTLCVPVIQGEGMALKFARWQPGEAMVPGPFGAEVPADLHWVEPELLITPLVAFDAGCWRLGYGGGFYDRSLEELRQKRPTRAVGLAYSAQEVVAVPREPTDQPLDAVVTELGLRRPR